MKLLENDEIDFKKLSSLVKNYPFKPYSYYNSNNEELTTIFLKQLKSHMKTSKFLVVEENGKYLAMSNLRKSEWDSNHFKKQIGKIDFLISTSDISIDRLLNSLLKSSYFDLIIMRIKTNNPSKYNLQKNGFKIMDTIISYAFDYQKSKIKKFQHTDPNIHIRPIKSNDIKDVIDIARKSFSKYLTGTDHFHADPMLSQKKSDELYVKWIKSIIQDNNYTSFVAEYRGSVSGFANCVKDKEALNYNCNVAIGTLWAVHPKFYGKGIYTAFVTYVLNWLKSKTRFLEITSQIDNVAVQNAWINNNFKVVSSEYTLHYHSK